MTFKWWMEEEISTCDKLEFKLIVKKKISKTTGSILFLGTIEYKPLGTIIFDCSDSDKNIVIAELEKETEIFNARVINFDNSNYKGNKP